MKSNKSISQNLFLTKFHFLQFQKWQKSIFELENFLKLPEMQFREKKPFDLFDFTSFFPGLFLNFMARCAAAGTRPIGV